MARDDDFNDDGGGRRWSRNAWKCPNCGRFSVIGRHYCDCHAKLDMTRVYSVDAGIIVSEMMNVCTDEVNCKDCGGGCELCYSFSLSRQNEKGFGGIDCQYRKNDLRCHCCHGIVEAYFTKGLGTEKEVVMRMSPKTYKNIFDSPEPQRERRWYED